MVLLTHCDILVSVQKFLVSVLLSSTFDIGVSANRVSEFNFIVYKFILNDTYAKIIWTAPPECDPDYYEVVMVVAINNSISRSNIGNSTYVTIPREVLSPSHLISNEIYIQAYSNSSYCAVSEASLLIPSNGELAWKNIIFLNT